MEREALKQYVEQLLSALGVTVTEVVVSLGARTVVHISSPDATLLIGKEGETLKAINLIAHRMVEKNQEGASHSFLIDVNGYYDAQLEKVRALARESAERARLFKHDIEMQPMSAYDRLVVHELFADEADIKTESAGEGEFRHVVLKYVVA